MPKKENRTYSRYGLEALELLSQHMKCARLERKITAQELSERAGISRGLLRRIESGDPACGIGVVFEVATLLGVPLFASSLEDMQHLNSLVGDKIALLPDRVTSDTPEVDDDF